MSLTRFTICPDRRADLLRAANAAGHLASDVSDGALLVELQDGDWLVLSISAAPPGSDDFAYLDLADGIVGDETGVIVAVAGRTAAPADALVEPWPARPRPQRRVENHMIR